MPHSLVYFFSTSACSDPSGTAGGLSVTPSSSPAPVENHGRLRYTRSPAQRRDDFGPAGSAVRSQPNSGTMYSGFGSSGRAELRMSIVVGLSASPDAGRIRFCGSAVIGSGKYSRKRVVAVGTYVTAWYFVSPIGC